MAALLEFDEVVTIKSKEPNRPLSRYNKIGLLLNKNLGEDAVAIQETWEPPSIPLLSSDTYLEVPPEYEHRPDLISLDAYGTEQLYWVIAYANSMIDPFAETIIGLKLRIPNRDNLFQTILAV